VKKHAQTGIAENVDGAEHQEQELERDEGNLQVLVIPAEAENERETPQTSPTDVPIDVSVSERDLGRVSVTVEQPETASPPPLSPAVSNPAGGADSTVLRVGFAPYTPASSQVETIGNSEPQGLEEEVASTHVVETALQRSPDAVEAVVNVETAEGGPVSPPANEEGVGSVVGHMNGGEPEAPAVTPAVSISVVDTMVVEDVATPAPSPPRDAPVESPPEPHAVSESAVSAEPPSPAIDTVLALPEPGHDNVILEDITSPLESPQHTTFVLTSPTLPPELPLVVEDTAQVPPSADSPREAAVAAVLADVQSESEPAAPVSSAEDNAVEDSVTVVAVAYTE
jgi:hypothetical protein